MRRCARSRVSRQVRQLRAPGPLVHNRHSRYAQLLNWHFRKGIVKHISFSSRFVLPLIVLPLLPANGAFAADPTIVRMSIGSHNSSTYYSHPTATKLLLLGDADTYYL